MINAKFIPNSVLNFVCCCSFGNLVTHHEPEYTRAEKEVQ